MMKNKIYDNFKKAVSDICDGATIAFSTFGNVSMAMNLWKAIYDMDDKD